jgi:hypothetical protein
MLGSLHATLEQIVIHDIKDATFFAKLIVRKNGNTQEIDARPSDGIALALRMQAPIYVSDKIELEESVADKKAEVEDTARFKKFMGELKPSDFKGQPRPWQLARQGKSRLWQENPLSTRFSGLLASSKEKQAVARPPAFLSGGWL